MSEELKVRQAKEGAIYLMALLVAQLLLGCAVWSGLNPVAVLLCFIGVFYFLYRAIASNAFALVISLLPKYFKWKRLHPFFESNSGRPLHSAASLWRKAESSQSKEESSWKKDESGWNNQESSDYATSMETQRSEQQRSAEGHFQKIEIKSTRPNRLKTKLLVHFKCAESPSLKPFSRDGSMGRSVKSAEYLKAREHFKKMQLLLRQKGIKLTKLQEFSEFFRVDYSAKIAETIKVSQSNLQDIINLLQTHFSIKVVKNLAAIPQKLEPVHIDEALARLKLSEVCRCLPWTQRNPSQPQHTAKVRKALALFMKERERIDRILCPDRGILNEEREEISGKAKRELGERSGGSALLTAVVALYNQCVSEEEYKLSWRCRFKKSRLLVVESQVAGSFHVDLAVLEGGKETLYHLRPGEHNFWSLLSVAACLRKYKK